jgi:hypothetical protein
VAVYRTFLPERLACSIAKESTGKEKPPEIRCLRIIISFPLTTNRAKNHTKFSNYTHAEGVIKIPYYNKRIASEVNR